MCGVRGARIRTVPLNSSGRPTTLQRMLNLKISTALLRQRYAESYERPICSKVGNSEYDNTESFISDWPNLITSEPILM